MPLVSPFVKDSSPSLDSRNPCSPACPQSHCQRSELQNLFTASAVIPFPYACPLKIKGQWLAIYYGGSWDAVQPSLAWARFKRPEGIASCQHMEEPKQGLQEVSLWLKPGNPRQQRKAYEKGGNLSFEPKQGSVILEHSPEVWSQKRVQKACNTGLRKKTSTRRNFQPEDLILLGFEWLVGVFPAESSFTCQCHAEQPGTQSPLRHPETKSSAAGTVTNGPNQEKPKGQKVRTHAFCEGQCKGKEISQAEPNQNLYQGICDIHR